MITGLFIALALVAAGLITELFAASRAPYGFQDEQGFHFGDPRRENIQKFELENPS